MTKLIVISIGCLLSLGLASAQTTNRGTFKVILSKHLKAIAERNLTDISATVADSVMLIFPNGEVLKSKQQFINFHKEWFTDTSWKMETEILTIAKSKKLSYSMVKYHFIKFSADGIIKSQSDTYLLLIFERQQNGWRLIHDQNTRIDQ